MTTEIKRSDVVDYLLYIKPGGLWIHHCEFCHRRHEGVWNSRVLAFVPQWNINDGTPLPAGDYLQLVIDGDHFSDGTPVAAYEGWLQ